MTAPNISESWVDDVFDAVVSDVQASGYFDKVNEHEPKRAPGYGLSAGIWIQRMFPVRVESSIVNTSACLVFFVRIYSNMLAEPQDGIDRNATRAASNLCRRWHDNFDFDLAEIVRNVDLLGISGESLRWDSGYETLDKTEYRVINITVPVIINDVWQQIA